MMESRFTSSLRVGDWKEEHCTEPEDVIVEFLCVSIFLVYYDIDALMVVLDKN